MHSDFRRFLGGNYNRCSPWPKLVSAIAPSKGMSNVNYRVELEIIFSNTLSKKEKAVVELREKAAKDLESQRREKSCGTQLPRCDFASLQFPESQRGRANDLQPVR